MLRFNKYNNYSNRSDNDSDISMRGMNGSDIDCVVANGLMDNGSDNDSYQELLRGPKRVYNRVDPDSELVKKARKYKRELKKLKRQNEALTKDNIILTSRIEDQSQYLSSLRQKEDELSRWEKFLKMKAAHLARQELKDRQNRRQNRRPNEQENENWNINSGNNNNNNTNIRDVFGPDVSRHSIQSHTRMNTNSTVNFSQDRSFSNYR